MGLGPAHPVHEAEACRGECIVGPVNAETSPVLHDPALDAVFIFVVGAKAGPVGRVEWFDSYEGPGSGVVCLGCGHVRQSG